MLETNRLTFKLLTMWFLFFFPVCKSNFHMKLNFSSITITFIWNLCHFLKLTIQNQTPYGKNQKIMFAGVPLNQKPFFFHLLTNFKIICRFSKKVVPLDSYIPSCCVSTNKGSQRTPSPFRVKASTWRL